MTEGEKDVYKLAKMRERKSKDFNHIKCIKGDNQRLLVKENEVKERWRSYFDKLFNGEPVANLGELDNGFDDTNRRFVCRIRTSEVRVAMKKMKLGKAMGPEGIPIETWRYLGDVILV
ncbi:uncharacterized protein LOC143869882 [Tasmannia lanceolata]|uniref:uncharacterized protein LOC143869882 n=1 Tax=Tasmannia lanceolata TaxID=3420 RepID=UPI004062CBC7